MINKAFLKDKLKLKINGYDSNLLGTDKIVWPHDTVITYPSVAEALYISSSDNGDTQSYLITGLDADYVVQTQLVTAAGQTQTLIGTDLTWIRVNSIENMGTTINAGTVYVYGDTTPAGGVPADNKIRGVVDIGANKSEMGKYTVPYEQTLQISKVYVGETDGDHGIVGGIYVKPFGETFKKELPIIAEAGMNIINMDINIVAKAKSDIEVRLKSAGTPGYATVTLECWQGPLVW